MFLISISLNLLITKHEMTINQEYAFAVSHGKLNCWERDLLGSGWEDQASIWQTFLQNFQKPSCK